MEWINYISQAFELIPFDFFKNLPKLFFDKTAIYQLPALAYLFWFAVFLFIISITLCQFNRYLLKARTIEDTPTAKIRSAAQGYTELWGSQYMLGSHLTQGPLTRLPCCWYRYKIFKKSRKNNWILVFERTSSEPFLIKDSTGECIVEPIGAEVHAKAKDIWYGFTINPKDKPKSVFWLCITYLFGTYQYQEFRMEEGSPIYVLGYFSTIQKNESSTHIVSQKGLVSRQPYLISNFGQKELARKYRFYAVFWLLVFLGALPYALWWMSIKL